MTQSYTGEDRRTQNHNDPLIICKQEDKINVIADSMIRTEGALEKLDLRINGTLEKMAIHVEDSTYWRRFIVGVAISLVCSILGGIATVSVLSYNLGQYTKQIAINTLSIGEVKTEFTKHMIEIGKRNV